MKKREKSNSWNWISTGVLAVTVLSEAAFLLRIRMLEMVPGKYLWIILGCMAAVTLLLCPLLFQRTGKWQTKVFHRRQIIAYLICAFILIGCLFGFFAVSKLDSTVSSISAPSSLSAIVNVYVLSDNSAASVEDAAGWIFGATDSYDGENSLTTLSQVQNLTGGTITYIACPDVFSMIDALYTGQVSAIILNEAYAEILPEVPGYEDFSARTRVLYQHSILHNEEPLPEEPANSSQSESVPKETAQPTEETKALDPTKDPFVVYLSGSDTRSRVLTKSRSDVNILAAINPTNKQILLVNTPRDYYVNNPAGDGAMDKLTHCGLYGANCSAEALSILYGQPVSYYAQINFTGFETLIDSIGGIKVHSDYGFKSSGDEFIFYRGNNRLYGKAALAFARERHNVSGGDNTRGKNQMKVIAAVVDKLTSGAIVTNYFDILDSLEGMFVTSMPSDTISDLVKMQLNDMAHWEVLSYSVTGTGGSDRCFSTHNVHAYVMYPDMDSVSHASDLLDRFLSGDVLTQEDIG